MPDNDPHPPHEVPLPVLSKSGKVEELKRDSAAAADPRPAQGSPSGPSSGSSHHAPRLAQQNVIDRVLDQTRTPEQKAIIEKIIDVLRTVYDPEIPVNIYDLGLIYDIRVGAENKVDVKMTLTAPGCPVAGQLVAEVETKIENLPEVSAAAVDLVWDPPWTKERMSEAAMLELGLM